MPSRPFYETWRRFSEPAAAASEPVSNEPKSPDVCEKCGFTWPPDVVGGIYPFCKGSQSDHIMSSRSFGYDAFEPYYDHHIPGGMDYGADYSGVKDRGHFIDSRSTRQRLMKEHNLTSGGKIQRRDNHNRQKDYDKLASDLATSAFNEWRQR